MAKAKGRRGPRKQRKTKGRNRKPNIAMLVYKFLSLGGNPGESWTLPDSNHNSFSSNLPKRRKQIQHSCSPRVSEAKHTINERKRSGKISKMHLVKRGNVSKEPAMATCVCRHGGKGIKKMKKYIQKALDFGVESGYLIPKDAAHRVLRVSSDLVSDGNYLKNSSSSGKMVSKDRDKSPDRTTNKLKCCDMLDAKCRRTSRKRRSRSRSGSRRRRSRRRKRGRRRVRSDNGEDEEVIENDDYEFDNQPEKKSSAQNASKEKRKSDRSNESDGEKTTIKREEDRSDLSADDDETDEDEKKGDDANKS